MRAAEQADTAPVESVALAKSVLLTFAFTLLESAKLKAPLPLATPLPTWPLPQLPKNTRTVVLAGAVPVTVGVSTFPGDGGVVAVRLGAAGAAAVVNVHECPARALPVAS